MQISQDTAQKLLLQEEIVGIPTDTVYGIGVRYNSARAIEKLFQLKNRPSHNPFVILTSSFDEALPFLSSEPPLFKELAKNFWPGPLTIVLPIQEKTILKELRAGLPTAGFRVPHLKVTQELLAKAGPLAVTSANLSGQPSAKSVQEIEAYFGQDFPILTDKNVKMLGLESTVIGFLENKWKILRKGSLPIEEIAKILKIL